MKKLLLLSVAALIPLAACSDASADLADELTKKLDAGFPSCTWEEGDGGKVGHIEKCREESIFLFTGKDHTSATVWLDGMSENAPSGWAVLGDKYVVVTQTRAKANRAWDVLGADGKIQPI